MALYHKLTDCTLRVLPATNETIIIKAGSDESLDTGSYDGTGTTVVVGGSVVASGMVKLSVTVLV